MPAMGRTRPRIRWLVLLDGPLGGERRSASIIAPGTRRVIVSGGVPDQPRLMQRHEYELTGPLEARWVRHIETVPIGL